MVTCTDDANTIGCLAERKDHGRVGYNFAARPCLLMGIFLPKARIHLMKSASEAPLSVTMARQAITTDMAKARIKGHQ
jgi:hypothetical protein